MISVAGMREAEARAVRAGIDEQVMMENAGANAARLVDSVITLKWKTVLVFCGTGNNAGDGLVFARHAVLMGASVKLYFVRGTEGLRPLAAKNYGILRNMSLGGMPVETVGGVPGITADILVDAMLGTGLKGDVSGEYFSAIGAFNLMGGTKVSMDCPSGLDADTGRAMGIAVKPDITVTFHDAKPGLRKENSGRIVVAGIGIPKSWGGK